MYLQTTNICDSYYLGTYRTLSALSPLLQKRSVNPHATFLTLYMTAVNKTRMGGDWAATRRIEEDAILPYALMSETILHAGQDQSLVDQAEPYHYREVADKGENESWARRMGRRFRDSPWVHGFSMLPVRGVGKVRMIRSCRS
jgi:hypothetical protein